MSQMKQCGVVYLWLGWDGKVTGQGNYVSEVWREVVVIGVREKDGKLIDFGDFITYYCKCKFSPAEVTRIGKLYVDEDIILI